MFYFNLKKKKKRDRDFSIISVGRERAIKQVFFLGLTAIWPGDRIHRPEHQTENEVRRCSCDESV